MSLLDVITAWMWSAHKGSLAHIPPSVVHGAKGRMRVLVAVIPDIRADDLFFPAEPEGAEHVADRLPGT